MTPLAKVQSARAGVLLRLLAILPLPGRPFRAENGLWPSGDVVLLCSVEGVY